MMLQLPMVHESMQWPFTEGMALLSPLSLRNIQLLYNIAVKEMKWLASCYLEDEHASPFPRCFLIGESEGVGRNWQMMRHFWRWSTYAVKAWYCRSEAGSNSISRAGIQGVIARSWSLFLFILHNKNQWKKVRVRNKCATAPENWY